MSSERNLLALAITFVLVIAATAAAGPPRFGESTV
jgi:hypothetical protein